MKKTFCFSSLFVLTLIAFLQTSTTSCKKEVTRYDTVMITHTDTLNLIDTVVIKDTPISVELLTANAWKLQEYIGVAGNDLTFYERGGTDNTRNFDDEYIQFNADKTGIYHDVDGKTRQITWDFLDASLTKLTWTILNEPAAANEVVVYDNMRYKNLSLLMDQYWSYDNLNNHAQIIRIPK